MEKISSARNQWAGSFAGREINRKKVIYFRLIKTYFLLQKHMKRVTYSMETQKMEDKVLEERRTDERQMDTKLLLHAVDYIEKCLRDSRKLIASRQEW